MCLVVSISCFTLYREVFMPTLLGCFSWRPWRVLPSSLHFIFKVRSQSRILTVRVSQKIWLTFVARSWEVTPKPLDFLSGRSGGLSI